MKMTYRQAPPLGFDPGEQVARWWGTTTVACWGQVCPKDGMVDVPPAVEPECWLQRYHFFDVIVCLRVLVLLHGRVVVGNVGLVVFRVMNFHNLATDNTFKGAIVVLQIWKSNRGEVRGSRSRRKRPQAGGPNLSAK